LEGEARPEVSDMGQGLHLIGRRRTSKGTAPSSSPAFAFTIQPWVRIVDRRLAKVGGHARFGMDDGYLVGPREIIFEVLEEFAKGIKERT
jgi:hypothetical protein